MRTKSHESIIETPSGIYSLQQAVATGYEGYRFATNVRVETTRDPKSIVMTLAVNPTNMDSVGVIAKKAASIRNSRSALEIVEDMRHALFDYIHMPPEIYKGVTGSAAALTLAGASRLVKLDHPEIVPRLHEVLVEYELATSQDRYADIHREIAQAAFKTIQPVS